MSAQYLNIKAGIRLMLWLLVSLAAGAGTVVSQTPDAATKFRLGGALEQAGDLEHAVQVYRDLEAKDPSNPLYADALQRVLLQLKRYDEAIALANKRLARSPGDVTLQTSLGTMYYRAGREKEAVAVWDRVIAQDPSNPTIYRIVASAEVENRLLDRAAETYRRGRTAVGDPTLFALELSQLLTATMDYAGATRELLRWLEQNPAQSIFVQSRMSSFSAKSEARSAAIAVITEALKHSENSRLYELLGWMYMEGKEYNKAYDVYVQVDRLSGSNGTGLLAFADRASHDRAYDVAVRAYRSALAEPLPEMRRPSAMFGHALALQQLSMPADSSTDRQTDSPDRVTEAPGSDAAVQAFNEVIAKYPNTEYAARSMFQIGVIRMDREADIDGARRVFLRARDYGNAPRTLRYDIGLRLGALALLKGDTTAARGQYATVSAAPDATPDQNDEASFRLAELEYFAGRFEQAKQLLETMSMNIKADFANDALALRAFLQENLGAPDALKDFARADFLARQRRNTEAIAAFQQVMQRYPQALLVDDALMKIATLQRSAGMYQEAVTSYRTLLDKFKESSIELDHAQFQMAEVYERNLKNKQAAAAAYEELLANFPNSLLADQARKRIRALRGERVGER